MIKTLTVMSLICLSLSTFANPRLLNGCSYEAFQAAEDTAISIGFSAARPATHTMVVPVSVEAGDIYTYTFNVLDGVGHYNRNTLIVLTVLRSNAGGCKIVDEHIRSTRTSNIIK